MSFVDPGYHEVWLYTDSQFRGACHKVKADVPALSAMGINDKISSLRAGPGVTVELFVDSQYRGSSQRYTGSVGTFGSFNDKVGNSIQFHAHMHVRHPLCALSKHSLLVYKVPLRFYQSSFFIYFLFEMRPGKAHLVVALGNPGSEHAASRHNAGWMVVDRWAAKHRLGFSRWSADGHVAEVSQFARCVIAHRSRVNCTTVMWWYSSP